MIEIRIGENNYEIDENGIEAVRKAYIWANSEEYYPIISSLNDFIKLSTPIIAGNPRSHIYTKSNIGGEEEFSVQASKTHSCYPRENGLPEYEEYEILMSEKSFLEGWECEYDTEDAYNDGSYFIINHCPKEDVERIISFLYTYESKTIDEILYAAKEQLDELGELGAIIEKEIIDSSDKESSTITKERIIELLAMQDEVDIIGEDEFIKKMIVNIIKKGMLSKKNSTALELLKKLNLESEKNKE